MSEIKSIFCRLEKKFLASKENSEAFFQQIQDNITPDEFGESTICNLYYDTENHLLIRRSLEKPDYKEKLRLRCYGIPSDTSTAFVELKKKIDGVVYKRRVSLSYQDAMNLLNGKRQANTQIEKEIMRMFEMYPGLAPSFMISYHRTAFFSKADPSLRITKDQLIQYRENDLDLRLGSQGKMILPNDPVLLEIKTSGAYPLWLAHAMNDCKIERRRFTKYGYAFLQSYYPDYFEYMLGGVKKW